MEIKLAVWQRGPDRLVARTKHRYYVGKPETSYRISNHVCVQLVTIGSLVEGSKVLFDHLEPSQLNVHSLVIYRFS